MKKHLLGLAFLALAAIPLFGKADAMPDDLPFSSLPLVNAAGKTVSSSVLQGKKLIGLYFSAHWCGPCRAFTPKLVEFRAAALKKGYHLEIVFVSSDKDVAAMKEYMAETGMKWPAIRYDAPELKKLKQHFGVSGIPTLIILDGNGNVVSSNGRMDVVNYGVDACKYWLNPNLPKPEVKKEKPQTTAPKANDPASKATSNTSKGGTSAKTTTTTKKEKENTPKTTKKQQKKRGNGRKKKK